MVEHLITTGLRLHVILGSIALLAALLALSAGKGSQTHRRSGRIFVWSMIATTSVAIGLTIYRFIGAWSTDPFGTFLNGAMTLYYCVMGYREAVARPASAGNRGNWLDLLLAFVLLTLSAAVAVGILFVGLIQLRVLVMPLVTHTILIVAVAAEDLRLLAGRRQVASPKQERLNRHLSKMLAAFSIGVIALAQQQIHFVPSVLRWLCPVLLAAAIMLLWRRRLLPRVRASAGLPVLADAGRIE